MAPLRDDGCVHLSSDLLKTKQDDADANALKRLTHKKKENELTSLRIVAKELIADKLILGYKIAEGNLCTKCSMPKLKSLDDVVICAVCDHEITEEETIEEEVQNEIEEAVLSNLENKKETDDEHCCTKVCTATQPPEEIIAAAFVAPLLRDPSGEKLEVTAVGDTEYSLNAKMHDVSFHSSKREKHASALLDGIPASGVPKSSAPAMLKDLLEASDICRDYATGLIGSRVRQGYSLSARPPCHGCSMPFTEFRGEASCVVCQAFIGIAH